MGRVFALGVVLLLASGCSEDSNKDNMGGSGGAGSGATNATSPSGGSGSGSGGIVGAAGRGYPDVLDPKDSPPKVGEPGCGFETAAFCDTFGGPSTVRGRGGDLHRFFWSAGRMLSQLSATRVMGIGMATIPECRPELPTQVFPDEDTLICNPTFDVESGHLLIATAAQNYGQNGYRIRQPFDFSGRTGKVVFDASTDPLGPLHGWISLAITEDPMSMPGYSIVNNDEGSIIPKNAVEIHFANGSNDQIGVRNIQVFRSYVDTVYEQPPPAEPASHSRGKLNHFEVLFSADQIEVRISPHSEDGVTFAEPTSVYQLQASLPLTRGYVHLSLHNHASIKYTQPDSGSEVGVVNAPVARIDNVGFDGPVITNWREYEIPDALVQFSDPNFLQPPDPANLEGAGVDIGYVVQDAVMGPGPALEFQDVDTSDIVTAKLSLSWWVDFLTMKGPPAEYTLQARLNGGAWHDRKLSAEEAEFLTGGPTTLDPDGQPIGAPGSQGRYALLIDIPPEDLVDGSNTVEFVTANVPTGYPPLVCNIDLVLQTN